MMMGDLVLRPAEVNPVLQRLRARGIAVTAIHNHLLFERLRLMYMHYMGSGPAPRLAQDLRYALEASATPLARPATTASGAVPGFAQQVETGLGHQGTVAGGVLVIGVPRAGAIQMDGATLPPAMGVAEAMNFQGVAPGRLAATGDFVLLSSEVEPVMDALIAHGFTITALHTHMLSETPHLYFMHYWDVAATADVVAGLKAALARIAVAK